MFLIPHLRGLCLLAMDAAASDGGGRKMVQDGHRTFGILAWVVFLLPIKLVAEGEMPSCHGAPPWCFHANEFHVIDFAVPLGSRSSTNWKILVTSISMAVALSWSSMGATFFLSASSSWSACCAPIILSSGID